ALGMVPNTRAARVADIGGRRIPPPQRERRLAAASSACIYAPPPPSGEGEGEGQQFADGGGERAWGGWNPPPLRIRGQAFMPSPARGEGAATVAELPALPHRETIVTQ